MNILNIADRTCKNCGNKNCTINKIESKAWRVTKEDCISKYYRYWMQR